MITFDQYQAKAMQTARYPREIPWLYPALALGEEAGEVQGKLAKLVRDKGGIHGISLEDRLKIRAELGDVLWDLSALAHELGFRLSEIAYFNLEKLDSREKRGMLSGSGDER